MYRRKNSIQLLVAILIGLASTVGTLLLLSQGASARPMLDEDNLTISKSQSNDYTHPGDQLVYTLTYQNTSTDTVNGIIITDTLDPNVSYVSASLTPSMGMSNTLYWNVGSLAPTASGQITLRVAITSPLTSGTIITNNATIDGDQTNPKITEVTATVETATSVTLAPATASITAGQTVPYTLTAHGSYGGEWDVTESGYYTTTPSAGGSWVENVYTAATAGAWIVTGTHDTWSDTAVLTVTHADATDLTLAPATATITTGQAIPYTLTAFDAYDNAWDVTSDAAYTITPGAGGTWVTNVYTAQVAGSWTVTGTFNNIDDTAILTVTNAAPTIENVTHSAPANEGSPTTVTITASDPENDTLTYGFDWDGNGLFTDPDDISDQSSNQADHTWPDDGVYTITVQVFDGSNTVTDTATITVTNVPPSITSLTNTSPVDEGSPVTITATTTDPGADTPSYAYDWNKDGDFEDDGEHANSHTWDDEGIHSITVQADDGDGGIVTDTTTITVTNVPPAITDVSNDGPVGEGSPATISITATDPGDDTLSYAYDWNEDNDFDDGGEGDDSHTWYDEGIHTITVQVDDGDGGIVTGTSTITVANVPPSVDAGSNQTVDEGDTVNFSGSFDDPGIGDTHTILWDFGDGATADNVLTPTHTYADNGVYTVTLTVTDDDGGTDDDTLTVTVNNVDPTVDAGPNQTVSEGDTVNFSGSFDDPGIGDTHTILWNFGDGATASDTLTPSHVYADDGLFLVTLVVEDDDGGVDSDILWVTVNNVTPTVDAGPDQTVNEGDTVNFDGSFDDPGADDTHDILWNFGDGATASGDLSPSHAYSDNGTYTVTLTVTDDDGGTDDDTLTVTVNNVDPTVDAGPDQTVDEADLVNFSGSFSDPGDDDTHTILWNFGDGATADDVLTPTHTYADDGIYTVTLTVTDDDGGTGDDTLIITVNNVDPVVDAGSDQTADEGETVNFSGSFSDLGDGDTHTILWNFGDGATAADILTPTHTYTDNGIYTVTLTVTDDDGGTGDDTLIITVNNVAPTVDAGSDQTGNEGETVNFSGSFDDPGIGDTHTILWNFGDGATAADVLTPTHIYADDGVYTVTLTVTDDDGGTDEDTLTVTVNNVPPIVNAGPDQRINEGETVNFSGSFDDPGASDTHDILWDLGNGVTAADLLTPTHTYTEPTSIAVTLIITDDDGGSGSDVMMVTVENLPPNADAGGPYTGIAGLPVTMTASASQDPGGGSLTYAWDLDGDGEYDDASGDIVTYTWTIAGVHTVTVQAADAQYAIDADSAQVSINPTDLNHIVLTPLTATIFAWETQAYTVEAFDVYSNSRGNVTGQTVFSIVESGHGGHWTGNVYNPQNLGDWTVQAVHTGTSVTTDTASLTVLSPMMHIEKEGVPDTVEAGAVLTYTLTYSNTGNLAATNVTITDTLSSNIIFAWADPEPDGGTPNAPYWNIGNLAPDEQGQIHITATVARPLPNGTVLTNTAWLDADHVAPLSATQQTTVTSRPVLTITKASSPDPVVVSQNLVYTIIITNSGNENASSVTITEDYDPNTSFVYASTPPDPGSENREWTFATLAVDDSIGIDIIVRVTDTLPVGTVLTNEVTLDSDQTTPISTTETTQVLSESILEVTYVLNEPNPVPAGDNLAYLIQCRNTGSAPAYGVVVTATYDSRVTYIGGTTPDVGDNVWEIGTLSPGHNEHIYIEVDVDTPLPNGSVLANLVTIDSNNTAPASFIETTVVTSSPELAFSVAQQPESTVEAGAPLTYTLHYTNTGNANGTQVVVTATFDSFAPFSSSTPPPTGGADNVRYWEIGDIVGVNNDGEVNGIGEIVIQADVTLPLSNGTPLNFTAQLEDAEGDFLEDTAQIAVTSAPILSLDKSNGVSTVYAGDLLTYTLTLTNSGNENAYNVFITDTLPVSYTQYLDCEIPGGTCQHVPAENKVIFYIPTIVAPTSGQAQVTLQVDDPLPSGADLVTNRVTMTHPSLAAPIEVQDVDLIGTLPDLTIDVTHSRSLFSPGKLMNYVVTYGNTGHMHAKDVVITTTLPLDTIYEGYGWTSSDGQTYTYVIGDLLAGDTGNTVTFTVKYPDSEPQQIRASEFDTLFSIAETGSVGGDTSPDDNSVGAYIGVPDLVVLDFTVEPLPIKANAPITFTILIENQGTGMAWNPDVNAGFWVDVFVTPIASYPSEDYGYIYGGVDPIPPGHQQTVVITHTFTDTEVLEEIEAFYVRVDNEDDPRPYGLVPESNEMNNLGGPVDPSPSDYSIYLPLVTNQEGNK